MKFLRLIIVIAVVAVMYQYLAAARQWPGLMAVLMLPGTFLHELAHFLTALAMDGHPGTFSILPEWDRDGKMTSMGHVTFVPNAFNAASVALAPLLLAPLTGFFVAKAVKVKHLGWNALYCYLAATSFALFLPSGADVNIALSYPTSWPFALIGLSVCTFITYKITVRTLRTS